MDSYLTDSLIPLIKQPHEKEPLLATFKALRNKYKRLEWAVEYYMPTIARFVNGAPLPEIEQPEVVVLGPHGLQVMEELIVDTSIDTAALHHETVLLKSYCISIKDNISAAGFTKEQLFDAVKKEIFRIITLGITGFDPPSIKTGIGESAVALKSMLHIVPFLKGNSALTQKINAAIHYLHQHRSFDEFDRMAFIKNFANPITRTLVAQQKQAGIPFIQLHKIRLGEKLFYDNILSKAQQRSCASCHKPELYFTDGVAKNTILNSTKNLQRNTPTLLNAALQTAMFYDLRTPSLEHQANEVVNNKDEMHRNFEMAISKITADTQYMRLYKAAYTDSLISRQNLLQAIASYIKSLPRLNSKFDEYMRGNDTAMNPNEIAGFNLFSGKAKCASCHFIPLFNGVVPPVFSKTESEVLGVPANANGQKLDTDTSRYAIINVAPYMHSFKTTTVRNAAPTAPYMHNGVFATLE